MAPIRDGQIFGMGNPLLDMQCTAETALLEKYKLKSNDAILAAPEHAPLFGELKNRADIEYIPGGATQNSMRVAQWVLQRPNTTTFMGSVGKDDYADILEKKARAAGVNVQYYKTDVKTGTCAVLITGHDRSMVADLAAANEYKIDHLQQAENEKLMKAADLYYISGFFLTVSPPSLMHVAQHSHEAGKVFTMNLSAPFLCQFFKEPMEAALPFCDILFGNETAVFNGVQWYPPYSHIQTCDLLVTNTSHTRLLLYKMKSTRLNRFDMRPTFGAVQALHTTRIRLACKPFTGSVSDRDRFSIVLALLSAEQLEWLQTQTAGSGSGSKALWHMLTYEYNDQLTQYDMHVYYE